MDEPVLKFAYTIDDSSHGLGAARYYGVEVLNRMILNEGPMPAIAGGRGGGGGGGGVTAATTGGAVVN